MSDSASSHESDRKPSRLCVFIKSPRPGRVKTRLAASLGAEMAAHIYRILVERLMQNLRHLEGLELHFSPHPARGEIQAWLGSDHPLIPQCEGDLGQRMAGAIQNCRQRGAGPVALIGSDCPAIMAEDIQEAFARLKQCDVVLGPTFDGGYWLIGMNRLHPELFQGIDWSTDQVFRQTWNLLQQMELKTQVLERKRDVDTEEDWRTIAESLS